MDDGEPKLNVAGACGIYCGICPMPCEGCGRHEGGAFWCDTFGPCELYRCCRKERELPGCEHCDEFPCGRLLEMTFDVNHPEGRDRLSLALLRRALSPKAWASRLADYFSSLLEDEG